ncbi:uncharacterized protein [Asterias amurensis]|uniref:uncharacterized protein isoform X3 n=1 Tax=Asterias amurensis TaxID=7602 RepID=UPI003AB88F3B
MGKCLSTLKPHDLLDSRSHFFKSKVFKHPNTCQVCNEVIWNEGRSCKACKFACHRKCQYKVTTECKSSVNNAQHSNSLSQPQAQKPQLNLKRVSIDSNQNKMTAHVHAEISSMSRGGESNIKYSFDLDVDYITERLIGVSFPSGGLEAQYRSNLKDVVRMLKSKHQDNYVIFNLSQKRHDLNKLNSQVYDLGWPDHLAPPLEKLCSICKHIETWLKAESQHVVVLHCKGGRGPIGMIVLAYMNYINITSNSETTMDRYAMKRFLEAKTESAMHPSQHRYVNYFTGLLMRSIQVNSAPLFLHHVLIHGVPNYDVNGGCRPFLRVYQGMQPIYTSPVFSVPEGTSRFAITLDQALPIRGDILIKCYHKKFRATTRDVIFRCQFHTTAIMECRLVYQKTDLDDACTDARFPEFTKVEFVFSQTPDRLHGSDYVPGSNFPVDNSDDPLIRWDSYENFDTTIDGGDYSPEILDLSINMNNNIPHSSAPDGSLYAEVQKTPSPIRQENPFFPYHPSAPTSPTSNQLKPIIPGSVDYEMGPRSPMQTTQMAVLRAKMNAQKDPGYQTSRQRTPSPRTPTSDPPSPLQPQSPSLTQPINQSPLQRPTELMNGPKSTPETPSTPQQKRMMNYKERRDLDDLLRGIGDNAPVNPSSDSQRPRDEVVEKRKIVDIQAQMSQLPPMESQRSPTPKIYYPQPRSALDLENPYAEITDAVPIRSMALNPEASQPNQPPIVEQIAFSHVEPVESMKMPDLDKLRTPQNHDNPTYAATKDRDRVSQSSTPQRNPDVSHLNNVNQYAYPLGSNQPSPVWEPQPLRAKKEQIVFIYKEDQTPPRGPPVPPLPEEYLRNQSDQPDSSQVLSSNRTSSEVSDDAMTWLQKQQQKLKEKREREGAVENPTFQTPRRELPRVPEPRREVFTQPDRVPEPRREVFTQSDRAPEPRQVVSPQSDRVPEPMYQSQIMSAPRDEIPTDNLTWLEQKQRKLQEKRQKEEQSSPLFINTSHQSPSYGTPSRTDSSGLNSTANGSLTRPQLTDLEKSISQLSNIKSPDAPTTHGPMTPPHTYEHESNSVQMEKWQSHQRPLNRQASDSTFDREKPISVSQQKNLHQAPQTPAYVASLPPSGSSHDHITNLSTSSSRERHQESLGIRASHLPPNTTTIQSQPTTVPTTIPTTVPTTIPTDLSRDSGYASSLSSTLTGNEPTQNINVTRSVEADGSEVTTTTTTECKKKTIHVFPGKEGFDMKKLPSLLMEEIKKDESGGLQSRLMELMKEKGVGGSPKQKRKVQSDQRQFSNRKKESSTVHSMSHKQQAHTPDTKLRGDLLKTVETSERDSSGLSPHNSSGNFPDSQSTNTRDFSSQFISVPSSPIISSSRRHNNHHQSSMTTSPNPLDKSLPKTTILKPSHSHTNQPSNKDKPSHDPHHQTRPVDSADYKTSKSSSRKLWSQSLPKSVSYKKHDNEEGPFKMVQTEALGSPHEQGFTHNRNQSSNQEVSSKRATVDAGYYHSLPKGRSSDLSKGHEDLKDSPVQDGSQINNKQTPSGFEHSTHNSMFYSLPRSQHPNHNKTPGAGLTSTLNFSHSLGSTSLPKHSHILDGNQTISGQRGKPMTDPAPFMDDTQLFQPVPSYQWVMQRIGGLRSKSQVNMHDQREGRENQSSQSKSDGRHYRQTQGGTRSKSTDRLSDRTQHTRDIQGDSRSKSTERVPDRTQFYRETQGGTRSKSTERVPNETQFYRETQGGTRSKSTDRLSDRTHHTRDIQGDSRSKSTERVPDRTQFYRETQGGTRSKSTERVPNETQFYRETQGGTRSKSTDRLSDRTQHTRDIQGDSHSKSTERVPDRTQFYRETQGGTRSKSTERVPNETQFYRETQGGTRSKSTDRLSDRTQHTRDIQGDSHSKSTERVPDRTQFYRETQGGTRSKSTERVPNETQFYRETQGGTRSKSTDRLSDRTQHTRDIQGDSHSKSTERVPDRTQFYRETQGGTRSKSTERVPNETQYQRETHVGSHSKSTELPYQTQYYKETHGHLDHEQRITETVRGRPLDRSKHRSEKRSQSQNHDVWQRRDERDNSQTEQRAVSADRSRLYATDYHDNSTRMEGGTAGHSIGSNNYGTIQSRHTNHSNNANPASVVTSGMSHGDQTNHNVNNINLMAGLEDAIRMLSEWTHLQNQELTNPGPSNSPPYTKHNTHESEVMHRDNVTAPTREPNLSNGWIGHKANYQSHTQQHRQPGSVGPAKEETFQKMDLHIDESQIKEPLQPQGRGMDGINDVNNREHPTKSHPPTGPVAKPSKGKQMPRRTPHQSGYDSDSAVQQHYETPISNHPRRAPSPETWLQNPGGVPVHESEYWNRMEGLKSPNPKEQWARKPEQQDYNSSSESLQNGGVTPRFPVGPKAYKNMLCTPIAIVGRPPHGPDAPYPLSPIKRDDRDVLDTSGLQLSPSRQLTTHTASPMSVDSPMSTSAHNTTPGTPEIITITRKRIVQNEVTYTQSEPVEVPPPRPQLPIMATVERLPAPTVQTVPTVQTEKRVPQNGQHYPVEVKVDRIPVTNYSIQEPVIDSKTPGKPHHPVGGFPPSPRKEVTFQDARGGVSEKPTGPQALAGSKDSPSFVQEQEIVPTKIVPKEVAPTWPIELEVHIKNEGMGPAISDVEVKDTAPISQSSPQPISSSVQYYKQTTYIQEPVSPATQLQPLEDKIQPITIVEPELQQGAVIQKEPNELPFSSANLSAQSTPPQYPTYSDRMKNKPPPPMYPTFSDRHRKAATGRTEEVSPQVANGYHTMYDNRGSGRVKRASTGSDGMWPARSPNQRKASDGGAGTPISGRTTPSNFYLMQHPSPYSSSLSLADTSLDKVRFVKDLSAWWYKPHISRDEAITMLKDKSPGIFVVRDSNSFPGAFGLAVKVAQLPPNAPPSKKATDPASELVRHFLIEPNPRGVRLKGCANEPIFGSLSALIYQHTLTQLALPCKLQLPETDPSGTDATDSDLDSKSAHNLLSQGAACNVQFLGTVEMESLTGPSAVGEATTRIMNSKEKPKRVVVHFKVSLKGITITDNQRKLFFRRHYPVESVLYCGMDSGSRKWKRKDGSDQNEAKIFGFVARKPGSKTDNQCHVFAEYEIEQPASAIVSFVTKVLLGSFQNQAKTP